MLRIKKIRDSLDEMESLVSAGEDKSKEAISRLAQKTREALERGGEMAGNLVNKAEEGANAVAGKVKDIKDRYERIDGETKRKICHGLGVVAAALVALITIKKVAWLLDRDKR